MTATNARYECPPQITIKQLRKHAKPKHRKHRELPAHAPLNADRGRHRRNEQRDLIFSFRAVPKTEEVLEAELMPEPGRIELRGVSEQATGLMRFDIQDIEIDAPTADLAALQQQTAQLEQTAQQGANALASYFGARFDVGLAQIAAKQDNLLRGIEAQALNGAARSISNQKGEKT